MRPPSVGTGNAVARSGTSCAAPEACARATSPSPVARQIAGCTSFGSAGSSTWMAVYSTRSVPPRCSRPTGAPAATQGVWPRRVTAAGAAPMMSRRRTVPVRGFTDTSAPVPCVRDPDAAAAGRDRGRRVADRHGRGDGVARGVHPGERPVQRVDHPHRAVARSDRAGAGADPDLGQDLAADRIDPDQLVRQRLGDPQRAEPDRHPAGESSSRTDPARHAAARVERHDRVTAARRPPIPRPRLPPARPGARRC